MSVSADRPAEPRPRLHVHPRRHRGADDDRSDEHRAAPGAIPDREQRADERGEDVPLDLDLERPGDGIDRARGRVDDVVHVADAGEQMGKERAVARIDHGQRHRAEEQVRDVGRLEPGHAAQEVLSERHGRPAREVMLGERHGQDESAEHVEQSHPEVAVGEEQAQRVERRRLRDVCGRSRQDVAVEVEADHRRDGEEPEPVDLRDEAPRRRDARESTKEPRVRGRQRGPDHRAGASASAPRSLAGGSSSGWRCRAISRWVRASRPSRSSGSSEATSIGWRNVTLTGPGWTMIERGFTTLPVPEMATGTTGTPASKARWNAPRLNRPSFPLRLRVPSGKRMTDSPSRMRCAARPRLRIARVRSPRSIGMNPATAIAWPNTGIQKIDFFATKRVVSGRAGATTQMSSVDRWLARKMRGAVPAACSSPEYTGAMPITRRCARDQRRTQPEHDLSLAGDESGHDGDQAQDRRRDEERQEGGGVRAAWGEGVYAVRQRLVGRGLTPAARTWRFSPRSKAHAMNANILGISAYYHDSAACPARGRRNRRRRPGGALHPQEARRPLPGARRRVLPGGGGIALERARLRRLLRQAARQIRAAARDLPAYAPRACASFLQAMPLWLKEKLYMKRATSARSSTAATGKPLVFTEHHESHAASAFFPSPVRRSGDPDHRRRRRVGHGDLRRRRGQPDHAAEGDALPALARAALLGLHLLHRFKVNSGEYKLMGLAPYGEPTST